MLNYSLTVELLSEQQFTTLSIPSPIIYSKRSIHRLTLQESMGIMRNEPEHCHEMSPQLWETRAWSSQRAGTGSEQDRRNTPWVLEIHHCRIPWNEFAVEQNRFCWNRKCDKSMRIFKARYMLHVMCKSDIRKRNALWYFHQFSICD